MAIVGSILKNASSLAYKSQLSKSKLISTHSYLINNQQKQNKELKKLLKRAEFTEFGKKYDFTQILKGDNPIKLFGQNVPIFSYDYMYKKFWHKTFSGVQNVAWPGVISNFALTSGTTNSSSKKIPVSDEMLASIKKSCLRQVLSISELNLPSTFYEKKALCVGSSTALKKVNNQFEGDLSGILTGKIPHWLNPFTKPSKKISAIKDWDEKLDKIVENASKWDIGSICGVPSWIYILINRILEYYQTDSIFNIWPNLKVFIHGGVSMKPYLKSFNTLFKEKVVYLDSYLSSEGFIGFQSASDELMTLEIDNGIYYEFIPFNHNHFDKDGNLIDFSNALTLSEIKENENYALLITTNSGAFRYLIGDTILFKNINKLQFIITGRTKHYLNLCGEHLSVDNMTQAITEITYENNISIEEFSVIGEHTTEGIVHKWYLASDQPINALNLKYFINDKLCLLNDDYKTERKFALKDIEVEVLPTKVFYDFLKIKNRYGSQNKFPRVLKGKLADDWKNYLEILLEEANPIKLYY